MIIKLFRYHYHVKDGYKKVFKFLCFFIFIKTHVCLSNILFQQFYMIHLMQCWPKTQNVPIQTVIHLMTQQHGRELIKTNNPTLMFSKPLSQCTNK